VSRFGDDGEHRVRSAKLLGTVLHLHRGTPYIYQGEELGMTNVPFPGPKSFLDIESVNYYEAAMAAGLDSDTVLGALRVGSRDNARSPMQWDDSEHAGFTAGTPWARVNPNHTEINAEAAVRNPDSVFHHYRRLAALRHSEPTVAHGDFHLLAPEHPTLYAFTRTHEGVTLLVVANFSAGELPLTDVPDLGAWAQAELLLGNFDDPASPVEPLRAWEARVLRQ
jgi:oligo-1,6-glucosidase